MTKAERYQKDLKEFHKEFPEATMEFSIRKDSEIEGNLTVYAIWKNVGEGEDRYRVDAMMRLRSLVDDWFCKRTIRSDYNNIHLENCCNLLPQVQPLPVLTIL